MIDGNVMEDAYQALMSVGHSPQEARNRLDKVLAGGKIVQVGRRGVAGDLQGQ